MRRPAIRWGVRLAAVAALVLTFSSGSPAGAASVTTAAATTAQEGSCQPAYSPCLQVVDDTPVGCSTTPPAPLCSVNPVPALPFDNVTAPLCANTTATVGGGQSVFIDLAALCSDVNSNLNPASFVISTPPADPLVGNASVDLAGVATYSNLTTPVGGTDSFGFTVSDTTVGGVLTSVEKTVTITVLGNLCDATTDSCGLTQVVTFNVIGTTLTMEQTGQFVALSPITLDGQPQIAEGSLNDLTILNARGDAAGWTVSAVVTDFGAPGAPTVVPGPGLPEVFACTPSFALLFPPPVGLSDRLCIPGSNLGWAPFAEIDHPIIPGDVAAVTAGPASMDPLAVDLAADWLAELIATGNSDGVTSAADAGILSAPASELCSAAVNVSGGTFGCDAALFLGVPASVAAGTGLSGFAGAILLTLA